jgi:hypothetical protein
MDKVKTSFKTKKKSIVHRNGKQREAYMYYISASDHRMENFQYSRTTFGQERRERKTEKYQSIL